MSTGLFPHRQTQSGARPVQPRVRAARERGDDQRVAEMLAEGWSIRTIAAGLHMGPDRVMRAYRRICAAVGEQP